MKRFLLATVSMVALTCATRAADMPAKAPLYAPSPVVDWTGGYIGIQGGAARRDASSNFILFDEIGANEGGKTGGTIGALLGYTWQRDKFVYGLEGDWSAIGAKNSFFRPNFQSHSYDTNWLATVRGRAGLAIDSTLFYVTGGVAFGHVRNSYALLNFDIPVGSFTQARTKAGWTVGAGVEHVFAPHWRARAEFRYADLGKSSVDCVSGLAPCSFGDRAEFRNSLTMGLVGVAYQFGGSNTANWSKTLAAVPVHSVANWTGAYIGIQGGAARHEASFDDGSFFQSGGENIRFDEGKTGGTVGGLLGYNWQKGSFVYGLEGDWSWIGASINRVRPVFNTGNTSTSYDIKGVATLRGRGGLAFDTTLLYFTGGLALGQVKNSVDFINEPFGNESISFTQKNTKIGWTAGVGVEHMFGPHWTARAEVRYVDLGNTRVDCRVVTSDINGCGNIGYRGEFSNTLVQGLVGLTYKF